MTKTLAERVGELVGKWRDDAKSLLDDGRSDAGYQREICAYQLESAAGEPQRPTITPEHAFLNEYFCSCWSGLKHLIDFVAQVRAEAFLAGQREMLGAVASDAITLVKLVLCQHQTAYAKFHNGEGRKVIESDQMAIGYAAVELEKAIRSLAPVQPEGKQ